MTEGTTPRSNLRGGGCLIAAGLIVGAAVGVFFREGSIGLVVGLVVGAVAALGFYLIDRRRG